MYRKELATRIKDAMAQEEADQEIPPQFWEYNGSPGTMAVTRSWRPLLHMSQMTRLIGQFRGQY
jgi:hypothetical protein